jgi:carboxyl-terminal processing protease
LPEDKTVVTTKGRGNVIEEVHHSRQKDSSVKPGTYYPMAILLNRFSASASEIVAAALQDHGRAVIVGERSYGKGSVQNLIPMEDDQTALKITTASYWRPNNRNIHRFPDSKEEDDWGVKPDKGYDVKLTDEDRRDYFNWRRERDIVRRPGDEAKPVEPAGKDGKKTQKEFHDKVLDKALEYIRAEMAKKGERGAQGPAPVANPRGQVEPRVARPSSAVAEAIREPSYRDIVR